MHFFWQFKDHNSGSKKNKLPLFFIYFLSSSCFWYSFLYLKIVKINFHRSPLWSILVCKIPELWRWKLWDQNFVPFKSGNKQIKKSKKPGFTFSLELRTKFVWSHGLWKLLAKKKQKTFFLVLWKMSFSTRLIFLKYSSQNSQNHMMSEWWRYQSLLN